MNFMLLIHIHIYTFNQPNSQRYSFLTGIAQACLQEKNKGIFGSTLCDGVCQTAGKPLSCSVPTIIRKIDGAFPGW
jgi:hypothetical protein